MSKETEFHKIIGKQTLQKLPLTIKLVDPRPIDINDIQGSKVVMNNLFQDEKYICMKYHKPISKMI